MTPPTLTASATAESGLAERSSKRDEPAVLLDHAYDGIREYDNPLPGWWRAIFWATIVFSAGYWAWFHVAGWGSTQEEAYNERLAVYQSKKELREAADARDVSEDSLARAALDDRALAQGKQVYATRCASCHADDGRGLIGPNLTDNFQMHGATRMDILKTVRIGVPGTAMLPWSEQLGSTDVIAVTAYLVSLRGTNVKGKEPQGAPVEPFSR
jgi:cytochrome c oxidase cbb3-type subunit III